LEVAPSQSAVADVEAVPALADGAVRRRHPAVPWAVVVPIAIYAGLALAAYYPTWPGDPSRLPQCTCSDAGLNTWFLAATAQAVAHGHNPFFTTLLNYPVGVNLTYNTQMPLLGLVAAPLTLTAGPVSSLNLLMWLAFPLSATSMFLVLRQWTSWTPATFAGGLLYGFSPYMAGQSTGHLHLLFVPIPPLIVLAVVKLLVVPAGSPRRWGAVLGLLLAAQFLISAEVLVTTVMVVGVGLVILAARHPGQVVPAFRLAAGGLLWGVVLLAAVLAFPAWMFLAGPQHSTSASIAGAFGLRSDLLSSLVPTSTERLTTGGLAAMGDRLTLFGDYTENGSYLGIPLLVLLSVLVWFGRRNRWIRLAAVMALVTVVLTLGTRLTIDGRVTGVPLPDALLVRIPLVDRLIPTRISLFTFLCAAVVLGLGFDTLHSTGLRRQVPDRPGGRRAGGGPGVGWVGLSVLAALAVVSVLAVVSLVPRWPNRTVPVDLPTYFTTGQVSRIPPGSVALTYPYATPLHAQPMVWQAETGMRFSLIGGYALIPDPHGVPTLFPSVLRPSRVQSYLVQEAGGVPFYNSPPVADNGALVTDVRQFLHRYRVDVVLVDPSTRNAGRVVALFDRALGVPPVMGGGMDTWYGVPRAPGLATPSSTTSGVLPP
jgi:hypothetical protein